MLEKHLIFLVSSINYMFSVNYIYLMNVTYVFAIITYLGFLVIVGKIIILKEIIVRVQVALFGCPLLCIILLSTLLPFRSQNVIQKVIKVMNLFLEDEKRNIYLYQRRISISGDLLSACPHRQFHTLPGL